MFLKVIGTGSKGNSYLLENRNEALLIECGMPIDQIKKSVDFDVSKIKGCIVTHEHQDHCKTLSKCLDAGIEVFTSNGTIKALNIKHHRLHGVELKKKFTVGGFTVLPFDVKHDAAEPLGFLIHHKDCGNVLFLTDTFYSPYEFKNLNNVIIEANFSKEIIDAKMNAGATPEFLRNRILKSHLSLERCIEHLNHNDIRSVNNIVLIHLSDTNSHEINFKKSVEQATGKTVTVASNGLKIPFNKYPF